jgi:heat shock protein HslJ
MIKMKYAAVVALAGILILSLAACQGADSASGDPLDGTSWVLMTYRKTRPISGTTITATFEDGQVRGSAGCNSYGGSYQVSDDTITVGQVAITEMACLEPEGAMDQELVFVEFLTDAQTFRLADGQLQILRSDGEALTFVPKD